MSFESVLSLGGDYPSYIVFRDDGSLSHVYWELNEIWHRDNGLPAKLYYNSDRTLDVAEWRLNGKVFRNNDLPPNVCYHSNGVVRLEAWDDNFVFHRITGPCVIEYDENGNKISEQYYLDDKEVDKTEWLNDSRVMNCYRDVRNNNTGSLITNISL